MKNMKTYIFFSIIVYLIGLIIFLPIGLNSSGIFDENDNSLLLFFLLILLIIVILFIGGIIFLINKYKKDKLRNSIIHFTVLSLLLGIVSLSSYFLSILFVVPFSLVLTDYIETKNDKKTTKLLFTIPVIIIILLLILTYFNIII